MRQLIIARKDLNMSPEKLAERREKSRIRERERRAARKAAMMAEQQRLSAEATA